MIANERLLQMKKLLLISFAILLAGASCHKDPVTPDPVTVAPIKFIRSCDLSFVPQIREAGLKTFNLNGDEEDMLVTLQKAGMNVVRLRLWNHPADGYSGLAEVKAFADEIHALGLKVWLTVHYSDSWADPGTQTKPEAWVNMPFNRLKDSLYVFTKKVMIDVKPDYIQIGNEINNGLLWPDGRLTSPTQTTALLAKGIAAVRETDTSTRIMLHYAGYSGAEAFFTKMQSLDYDMIGLSYYPLWHGKSLDDLSLVLETLSSSFEKEIVIAETSYPFTFDWYDYTNNIIGSEDQILSTYAATAQGQKDFVLKIRDIVKYTNRGKGFSYWGGEFVAFKGKTSTNGSSWENQAFWDFDFKALPVIDAMKD